MRAYAAVLSANFRTLLQYRAAAIAGFATQIFWGFVRVMIFEAFFRSTTAAQPMNVDEVTTYVWLSQAFIMLLPWNRDSQIHALIRSGHVGYELLRPVDLYNLWLSRSIAFRLAPTLLRAVPLLMLALLFFGMDLPSSPAAGAAFFLSMIGALLISCALTTLLNITIMWTISGVGVANLSYVAVTLLAGFVVPIPFFPEWAQTVINVLPFRGIVDTPYRLYLGHIPPADMLFHLAHQLAWTIALVLIGRWALSRGPAPPRGAGRVGMINAVRLYLRYIGVSVRGQMQYRVSFVMETLGMVGVTGVDLVVLLVLFSRFQALEGWSLPEVAFLYGLVNLGFPFAETASRGFDNFGTMVRLGEFDRLLLRPRSTALQLAGQELELRRLGRLVLGFGVIVWASMALDVDWSAAKVAHTIATVLCGAALFSGLIILQATLAFWTTETLEVANVATYGGVQTTQYPLSIYRPWLRHIFTFVFPLGAISYFPALAILGKPDPLGSALWFQYAAPAIGVLFLLVCLRVWGFGVRHYVSTGS